jgi:arylsulfatase A-like enzyme
VQGRSLVPLLNSPAPTGPEKPAYTIWSEDGRTLTGVAVRTDKFRYAEFDEKAGGGAMLLDETADPHELRNLADDPKYATVRAEHSALIKEFKSRQN